MTPKDKEVTDGTVKIPTNSTRHVDLQTAQYKSIFYQTNHSSSIDVRRKDTQDNSGPFTPNQVICDQGSGATGYTLQKWHIFSETIRIPKRKFKKIQKTVLTPSLILRFNLRLGGYSIWSMSTSRTIYERKISGLEHLIASTQPR